MSVCIKMITPWRYNVLGDTKILSAFSTLADARQWVWRRGYSYIVDMSNGRKR